MSRLLLFLALSGCVAPSAVMATRDQVKAELARAAQVTRCSPRDLALAEANLAFAEIEMEQASSLRAEQHLQLALKHAQIAAQCAPVPTQPQPTPTPAPQAVVVKAGDTDKDGVPDTDDQCINNMEDLDGFKDADGCPDLDNDGDGIPDTSDLCPLQAEDKDGYNDADGCPETDNDGDGIADTQDTCPNEAGTPERQGCPVYDRDNDGVADNKDLCPDAPETVNAYLDEDGCPDNKPSRVEVTGTQIVIKQRINFATGKATILPDSFPVLDDVAQVLKDYPNLRIEIGGHTDNVGDDAVNQRLSKARADAVFEYLLSKGIPASRMQTMGYGETRPIDTNRTEEGRQNNRRVEFNIIGAPAAPPASPTGTPDETSPWG
jgi:outer membrane protein OmpA-like peptidoglycan-associated protein